MDITTSHDYEFQLSACNKCTSLMADKRVDPTSSDERVVPRPIVLALKSKPIMLIGQAPGLTEFREGKPFSGDAGKGIRRLFEACGCGPGDFERLVHSSAIAKRFPGSEVRRRNDRSRREDLKPSRAMIANCSPFAMAEFRIVNPQVIVLLGSMPISAYVQWKSGKAAVAPLTEWVGREEEWKGRRVIAMAHTSGLSTWLNDANNKGRQAAALQHLAGEIAALRRSAGH